MLIVTVKLIEALVYYSISIVKDKYGCAPIYFFDKVY